MTSSHLSTFRYGALTVRLNAAAPIAEWLDHFLRPWFSDEDGTPQGNTSVDVGVFLDSEPYAALRQRIDRTRNAEARCFLFDSRIARHPASLDAAGCGWIADDELNVVYEVRGGGNVQINAPADGPGTRVAVMRVVRELAALHAASRGDVLLHSSAVAFDGGALAMCGPKRAGKTTLLLRLLAAGASFVANDRVVVMDESSSLAARGMPTIVALRGDTVDRFPAVAARLRPLLARPWLSAREAASVKGSPWKAPGAPIDVSPRMLCDTLEVPFIAAAPLRAVLFPQVGGGERGSAPVTRLAPADVRQRLDGATVGAALDGARAEALWPGKSADDVARGRALDRLAGLPAWQVTLDDSDDTAGLPAEIVELAA